MPANQSYGLFSRLRESLTNFHPSVKSGIIGLIVGTTSGLAAIALNFGLKSFAGYFSQIEIPLLKFILPVLGLLLTVLFLKYLVKDFGGHGLPEVIHSISLKGGRIKFRSSFSKLIGSLITISTGGSAGPEAPVVISGAAIGSNFATLFRTDERIKTAVAGSGAAAAIAAIFNAPLTGIIFTMEVIIGEWTPIYFLPVVIASVTGTEISRLLNGNQIPFSHQIFDIGLPDILASIGLAVICALFSVIFIRTLRHTSEILDRFFKHDLLKAIFGGLVLAVVAYFIPGVRGEGYELIEEIITGHFSGGLQIILLIVIFKIIATSLTLGSGGAGGVFAPALVIGSATGLLYASLLELMLPGVTLSSAGLFALVGMSGLISGTLQAPLTGMFLIIEITAGYEAILPLLLVSFLTPALMRFVERHSIYHYELIKKGYLHRPRTDGRIMTDIKPAELLEKDLIQIPPNIVLRELVPIIKKSKRNYFPVVDPESGNFLGLVYFNDIKEFIFDSNLQDSILVEEIMHTDLTLVSPGDNLLQIQSKFDSSKMWSLPVVENGKFKGLISKATMLDLYRKELKVQTEK